MDQDRAGTVPVPRDAQFVALRRGSLYYWVGSREWRELPPTGLVWFETERAAREAGYRAAGPGFEGLIEEFEMLGELGRGSSSVVYRARDRMLERDVAVKVIHVLHAEESELIARFTREMRMLSRLRHPNVASIHAVKRLPGGGLALIMEYVPGCTLREKIAREAPLPVAQVERILRDVGAALAAAHEQTIVHRDVKPENIFIHAEDGRAVLADFGSAVAVDSTRITLAGEVLGTPAYMAPEQIEGRPLDGRSDLYSLALVGWEMLTGEAPWEGETLYATLYKQKHERLPSLRKYRSDVPARIRYALKGALHKEPEARWSGVEEFVSRLDGPPWLARAREWVAGALMLRRARPDDEPIESGAAGADPLSALVPAAEAEVEAQPTIRVQLSEDGTPEAVGPLAPPPEPPAPVRRRESVAAGSRTRLRRSPTLAAVPLVLAAFLISGAYALRNRPDGTLQGRYTEMDTIQLAVGPQPPAGRNQPAPGVGPLTAPPGSADSAAAVSDSAAAGDSTAAAGAVAGPDSAAAPAATPAPPAAAPAPPPAEAPVAEAPVDEVTVEPAAPSRIAAGGMHSCELARGGALYCWGANDGGQLGNGAIGGQSRSEPQRVEAATGFQSVAAGGFHTCALAAGGVAYCWGSNDYGQLGTGVAGDGAQPAPVPDRRFASLTLGMTHSCGLTRGGEAYCWGANGSGQLGVGAGSAQRLPRKVPVGEPVALLVAGWNHTCALARNGRAVCWGENSSGQLGDGGTRDRGTPTPVSGDLRFVSIAPGGDHTCAVAAGGDAYCWGRNDDGQLGDGTRQARLVPTRVRTTQHFVQVVAGSRHVCALTEQGGAMCWGQNTYGQLGDGTTTSRAVPVRVRTDVRFSSLQARGAHTCGVATDGARYCWGYNIEGQLGDGTQVHRLVPTRVLTPAAGSDS
jgi:serine/threonine protein kinase/alpha-tubulin suppressor-like RCC1 family protein